MIFNCRGISLLEVVLSMLILTSSVWVVSHGQIQLSRTIEKVMRTTQALAIAESQLEYMLLTAHQHGIDETAVLEHLHCSSHVPFDVQCIVSFDPSFGLLSVQVTVLWNDSLNKVQQVQLVTDIAALGYLPHS